jgi:arginine N-succinyltransferase
LLEWEGFRYDRVVDIFEGGPLVSAARDSIRTFREAIAVKAEIATPVTGPLSLIAIAAFSNFRCVWAPAAVEGQAVRISADTAAALGVATGENVLVWRSADAS